MRQLGNINNGLDYKVYYYAMWWNRKNFIISLCGTIYLNILNKNLKNIVVQILLDDVIEIKVQLQLRISQQFLN